VNPEKTPRRFSVVVTNSRTPKSPLLHLLRGPAADHGLDRGGRSVRQCSFGRSGCL